MHLVKARQSKQPVNLEDKIPTENKNIMKCKENVEGIS